jgi:hypothetical protein
MVMYMEVITLRIPEEIKRKMNEIDINWSEVAREAIKRRLILEKRKKAMRFMDEIRSKSDKRISMSEEVIKWRKRH